MQVSKRDRKESASNPAPTRSVGRILAVFAALLVSLTLTAAASAAASPATFIKAYGWGVVDSASQFEICTSSCQIGIQGDGAGQLYQPTGVATDSSGDVYVADDNRIDEFSAAGAFMKAYGWGVADGASQFETCTSSCEAGIAGGGAGQLYQPSGVATDSSGDVYVADFYNSRIDEFSAAGAFIKAYGWGVADGMYQFETCTSTCQGGIEGTGAGQFSGPAGVATDSSGDVNVADWANSRIDEFSAAGAFIEAYGWGVSDGMAKFETCTSSCQGGLSGGGGGDPYGGAGELYGAVGVATDPSGDVYVADSFNRRIDEFSAAGASYTLSVSLAGSGSGSVSGSGISCPGTCVKNYTSGTVVTLTATPSAGSTFVGWSGGGCSATGTCAVTMSGDQAVTAQFERRVSVTSLKLSAAKVVYGHEQVERLSVSVSSNAGGSTPTGKVTVQYFPKTVCVITLSAGRGSCTLKATQLPGGAYSLVARYSGSPVFDTSSSAQKLLLVDKAKSKTSLKLSAAKVLYGDEQVERLSVSVSSKAGGSKPSGKVAVKKSATKTVCVITLSAGRGSCTLKAAQLPGGTYSLVAAYSGSLDFDTSVSAKQTLTVATTHACSTRQLRVRNGGLTAASGHEVATFGFASTAAFPCTLYGYPRVRLLSAAGRLIPTYGQNLQPGSASYFGSTPAERVVRLTRGHVAWFSIVFVDPGFFPGSRCPTSAGLLLTPPGGTQSLTLTGADSRISAFWYRGNHLTCSAFGTTPLIAARYWGTAAQGNSALTSEREVARDLVEL